MIQIPAWPDPHKHKLKISDKLSWLISFQCEGCGKVFWMDKFRLRMAVKGTMPFSPSIVRNR